MRLHVNRSVRISRDLDKRIAREFISEKYLFSDFARDAIYEKIENKTSDNSILIKSIHSLNRKMETLEKNFNVLFVLFDLYIQHYYLTAPAIPSEMQEQAIASAKSRHFNFMKNVKKSLKQKTSFVYDIFREIEQEMKREGAEDNG